MPCAKAGVAVLVAGLAVVTIVHTDDGQVGRILQRDRGQRADIHQQFAVAGGHQHAPLRLRQRQA